MNRRRQGIKGLIGADVRSGALTADVLFAGRQREAKTAASLRVSSLAGEAAWQLADVFLACGDNPGVWTAKARRDSEALRFERDDVGFGGRTHSAERDAFGN